MSNETVFALMFSLNVVVVVLNVVVIQYGGRLSKDTERMGDDIRGLSDVIKQQTKLIEYIDRRRG